LPTAQYRYVELNSSEPISDIKFDVWWMDRLGGLHRHTLLHNGICTAKILFQRK